MPDENASPLTAHSPISLGDKIDAYWDLKNHIAQMRAETKVFEEQFQELERDLIHSLDDNGLTGSQGHSSRCSVNETEVAQIDDIDAVYDFIKEHDHFYLLQRRISSTAYRELKQQLGEEIPGLSSYTKRNISIRKLN
jgi:hypothetical protein